MIIPVEEVSFDQSTFIRGNMEWRATTLYAYAKEKKYRVVNMPLWCVDLSDTPFEATNLKSFIVQCKRVEECSLDYPIILDDYGQIADGYHRLCKAILAGKKTIKAIRLLSMPEPDNINE